MLVRLLHGSDLLPSGISGKDDRYPGYHYYLCYASCLDAIAMSRYLPLVYQASQTAMIASNLFHRPSKPLIGYVTALISPSYSIASCR